MSLETGTKRKRYKHGVFNKGAKASAEYRVWSHMRDRCNNVRCAEYPDYGGRGIIICSHWDDFNLFLLDMGIRPKGRWSIERLNVNGNYEPQNCIWADDVTQANNRRNAVRLTFAGITDSLGGWSKRTGLALSTIHSRYNNGWDVDRILTFPKELGKSLKSRIKLECRKDFVNYSDHKTVLDAFLAGSTVNEISFSFGFKYLETAIQNVLRDKLKLDHYFYETKKGPNVS